MVKETVRAGTDVHLEQFQIQIVAPDCTVAVMI